MKHECGTMGCQRTAVCTLILRFGTSGDFAARPLCPECRALVRRAFYNGRAPKAWWALCA